MNKCFGGSNRHINANFVRRNLDCVKIKQLVDMAFVNILVTGTPGVGKTTFCEYLSEGLGLRHINVANEIKTRKLYSEWDDDMQCSIFDEDMVYDYLEEKLNKDLFEAEENAALKNTNEDDGKRKVKFYGNVVDFHSCDFMCEEWFDAIFVLRAGTSQLFDRLSERKYDKKKIEENIQCEIFQIIFDECSEHFNAPIIQLKNDNIEQLHENIDLVYDALVDLCKS